MTYTETEQLFYSECEKDYKKIHHWEKIGVTHDSQGHYLIWRCSQCEKCVSERLEFLAFGRNSENDS